MISALLETDLVHAVSEEEEWLVNNYINQAADQGISLTDEQALQGYNVRLAAFREEHKV